MPTRTANSGPSSVRPTITPISAKTYLLKVTIREETQQKLTQVRDLLRHAVPTGDIAEILDRALDALLDKTIRAKAAATDTTRSDGRTAKSATGRHIPSAVRRAVWRRDSGRCAFVGSERRCTETAFLEFHHVVPFAEGGTATMDNIQLRCRSHNVHEARLWFGEDVLAMKS